MALYIMHRKKHSMEEKTRALTIIKEGDSITRVAANMYVSVHDISYLKQAATGLTNYQKKKD